MPTKQDFASSTARTLQSLAVPRRPGMQYALDFVTHLPFSFKRRVRHPASNSRPFFQTSLANSYMRYRDNRGYCHAFPQAYHLRKWHSSRNSIKTKTPEYGRHHKAHDRFRGTSNVHVHYIQSKQLGQTSAQDSVLY